MKPTVKRVYPPGPKGHPILGNLLERTKDPLGFFEKVYHQFGDFIYVPMLNIQVFLVSDPELIRKVLLSRDVFIKGTSYNGLRKFIGDGILTSNGPNWLGQRKYLNPFFINDKLPVYQNVFTDTLKEYLSKIPSSTTYDLKKEMVAITVENVARSLFGIKVGHAKSNEISRLVTDLAQLSAKYTFRFIRWPDWVPTSLNKQIKQTQFQLFALIDELFADIYSNPPQAIAHLSSEELRQQIITLFLAGHETTATTLVWALWHIAADPELQKECFNEINSCDHKNAPKILNDYPLINSILNECLRLYPPIWTIPRQVAQDTELGGYQLKKGEIVVISPYIMGRSEKFWDNQNKFNGKRFLNFESINKFVHLPFSRGPRSCMGEDFAMIEMVMTVAQILKQYHLEIVTPQSFHRKLMDPAVTLRQNGEFTVKLNERTKLASYQQD